MLDQQSTDPRPWLALCALPIGDQRNVVREFQLADGREERAYWSGHDYRRAPVGPTAVVLKSEPVAWRDDCAGSGSPHAAAIDALGTTLAALGYDRINLAWARSAAGEYYFIDGETLDGKFFSGSGDTPAQALKAAEESAVRPNLHGLFIDA